MKARGEPSPRRRTRRPSATGANLKIVLLALVAMMFAQGAVWYTAFFYIQTFMDKFLKVDPGHSSTA